jgi:hypothetical protein
MRQRRWWVLIAATVVALGAALAQWINDSRVRDAVCGESRSACTAGAGPLRLALALPLPGAALRLHGSTALLRRDCAGRWTTAFGARLQADALRTDDGSLALEGGCADLGMSRSSAALTGVQLRHGACTLTLAPVTATWQDALALHATARVGPEAAQACAVALGDRLAALGIGSATGWQLTLDAHHALRHGQRLTAAAPAPAGAASASPLRQMLDAVAMRHDLVFSAGASRLTLGLSSRPAAAASAASPEMTLQVGVEGPLAEHLPAAVRPLLAAGAPLQMRWNLDHDTGAVVVQGQTVRRLDHAPRAPGIVDLGGECPRNAAAPLHFVEAGERGEAVDPAQLQAVLRSVDAAQARAGALVSVFVHGWQHSAAVGDSYVCDFAALLRAVDTMEHNAARAAGRPPREVLGVYVGWPGHPYPTELANLTTFWNRLDAADRLGVDGGALRTLLQSLAQRITGVARDPRPDRRSGLVVTGHSMGGRAVFQAVRQAFEPGSAAGSAPLPDLLLLVNPAFSAEQFRAAHAQRMACTAPALSMLLFSSEADVVTRQVYPAGQVASFDAARQRQVPFLEHAYTAANFDEFVTHRLGFELLSGKPPEPGGPQNILRGFERVPAGSDELFKDNPVTVYRQPASGRPTAADAWYRMLVVPERTARAPCEADRSRVMKVDARILPDHGTIFTPAFMEFVIRSFNHGASARPGPA